MQFEWWRKREEKREPAIRLVRDSSSGEGGGGVRSLHFCFGMVLSGADGGLFREFRPAYSEEYARIASIFPIGEKCRNWNGIRNSRIFFFFCLVFYRFHVQVIFLLDTVHCVDHPSRYLFFFFVFPSAVCFSICLFIRYSSFHYCFLSFFSFRFANPFFVAIFYKILHCISHGIFFDQKKKRKTRMEGRSIRRDI